MSAPVGEELESPSAVARARLERKRAVDRKAQHAARERYRKRVEFLEKQIETLSKLSNEELQRFSQEKGCLEAENADLRARLSAILSHSPAPSVFTRMNGAEQAELAPDLLNPRQPETIPATINASAAASVESCYATSSTNLRMDSSAPITGCISLENGFRSIYECVPLNTEPVCLSDRIMHDYVAASRQRGWEFRDCHSCPYVSLLFKHNQSCMAQCPSVVVTDILAAFNDIVGLSEQVAGMLLLYKLLIWKIRRDRESFEDMPEWLKPVPIQLRIPHPAWMDSIPWPNVRAYLISNQNLIDFEEFAPTYNSCLAISWPYPASDVIVSCPSNACNGGVQVNPAFVHHFEDLKNWRIDPSLFKRFPTLAASMKP